MERPALPTLRQLAYLVELSKHLNFRVAAEAQFVTQSTLSAGIKELETLLGVQLVERDNRNVRLTAIGEDVVARAKELLAAATDLAEAARSATRPLSGPLRLGAIPTIAPSEARWSRCGRSTPATCCCWKRGTACATTPSRRVVPAAAPGNPASRP